MKRALLEICQHIRANRPLQSTLVCLVKMFNAGLLILLLRAWDVAAGAPPSVQAVPSGWEDRSTAVLRLIAALILCAAVLAFEVLCLKKKPYGRGLWPLLPVLYALEAISLALFEGYLGRAEFAAAMALIRTGTIWSRSLISPVVHGLFMLTICISLTLDAAGRFLAWRSERGTPRAQNKPGTWFARWGYALGRAAASCALCAVVVSVMVISSMAPHPVLCLLCLLGAIAYLLARYRRECERIRSGAVGAAEWAVLLALDVLACIWLILRGLRCVLVLIECAPALGWVQSGLCIGLGVAVIGCLLTTRILTGRLLPGGHGLSAGG